MLRRHVILRGAVLELDDVDLVGVQPLSSTERIIDPMADNLVELMKVILKLNSAYSDLSQ